jgi:hypothetical protein
MSAQSEWDALEAVAWDDPKMGAFYVGYQIGLERAAEVIDDTELKKVFGVRIAKMAVDTEVLRVRAENYSRAVRLAAKSGRSLVDCELAITADGIKLRPHDLVERGESA